jgi:tetratricopeptide (TPR) repeat protein|nr:MAG TPA: Tetratricopeptide repeat [Caudoviricetes sp.]
MINTSFSNNMKYLIILAIIVIGLICYSIDSKPEPIKISHAQAQQQAKPENKPQKLTQTECEKLYDTTLQDYSINKQAGKETEINDYYTKCGAFSPREKQSFLSYYYWGLAEKEKNQYNYEKAITYYHKALEANQKSTNINDKKGTMWLYHYLSECYFNTWQMEEAKKYALLTVQEKQRLGKSRVGLVDYERLGDICYNLKQYDEAENYYIKALQEIEYLRNLPLDVRNRMDLSDLDAKEEKFISILNGTFSQ